MISITFCLTTLKIIFGQLLTKNIINIVIYITSCESLLLGARCF
jgi:hypothetical protein